MVYSFFRYQIRDDGLFMNIPEHFQPLLQKAELLRTVELGDTDADSVLAAAGKGQRNRTDTAQHQITHKLRTRQIPIADCKEKSSADFLIPVPAVNHMEAVFKEEALDNRRPAPIFRSLVNKIQCSVRSGLEHGCKGILGRMACSGRHGIKNPQN